MEVSTKNDIVRVPGLQVEGLGDILNQFGHGCRVSLIRFAFVDLQHIDDDVKQLDEGIFTHQ